MMSLRFVPVDAPILHRAPPGWRWRTTTGAWWNCWCALDGRCVLRFAAHRVEVVPGTCVMLPPATAVAADHDLRAPASNLAIHGVFRDGAGRLRDPDPAPPAVVRLPDALRLARLAEDCLAAWSSGGADGRDEYAALAQALLARLRRQAAGGAGGGDRALHELLLEVHRHPGQAWTVASCAARLGLSTSQLNRRCHAAFGRGPAQVLARCRDEYALRLVRESDLPLAEIARQAGYVDASHLHRRLRGRLGGAPGQLRRHASTSY